MADWRWVGKGEGVAAGYLGRQAKSATMAACGIEGVGSARAA